MKIIYLRCSSLQQESTLQLKDIQSAFPGSAVIYKENESAWKENVKRPEFEHIKELIGKNQVRDLYIWDLDRLYRNMKRLQEFFIFCKNHNCKIHSFRQNWLDELNSIPAPWNDVVENLLISILGFLAQDFSTKNSMRVKLATRKKKDGKTYSYRGNKWGRKALPKQTINRILELHEQGLSVRKIADRVMVYDKNNNGKKISIGSVHKTIAQKSQEKDS